VANSKTAMNLRISFAVSVALICAVGILGIVRNFYFFIFILTYYMPYTILL